MLNDEKILAIIPARCGSKGLKDKNILPLANTPLIGHTLNVAISIGFIDRIIVSTDCKEIAGIVKNYGDFVPFLRPPELATDKAGSLDVILHTIDYLESQNERFKYILFLQPTSPLRTSIDIEHAFSLLDEKKAEAIISVSEMEHSPLWSNTLSEDLCMHNFIKKEHIKNRQELPTYYRINGAIYIADITYFKKQNGFHGPETYAYIMPPGRSVDIDNEIDLELAELLLKRNEKNN